MTITIDVCWMDHVGQWWDRHSSMIGQMILFIVLAGAIPIDVYLIGAITGIFEYNTGMSGLIFLTAAAFYALFGTLFFVIMMVSLFADANEKHKWFKVKHCEVTINNA